MGKQWKQWQIIFLGSKVTVVGDCNHDINGQLLFFFLWQLVGSSFPDQGSNLFPLQWKLGVLTTGPSGESQISGLDFNLPKAQFPLFTYKLALSLYLLCLIRDAIIYCLSLWLKECLSSKMMAVPKPTENLWNPSAFALFLHTFPPDSLHTKEVVYQEFS